VTFSGFAGAALCILAVFSYLACKLLFWDRFFVGMAPLVVERERINFEYEPGYAVPSGETVIAK
jgi:hypothetical protein